MHEGKTLLCRASKLDCDVCQLKPQCCPKESSRKIRDGGHTDTPRWIIRKTGEGKYVGREPLLDGDADARGGT